METKYKIWIEEDGKVIFGKGRDNILKAVEDRKSLNAAVKKLEMSYRAAWGRLKASEERMGIKLIEAGPKGKSLQLTTEARAIIERFEKLERAVEALLQEADHDFKRLIRIDGKRYMSKKTKPLKLDDNS
jgi:molybdate transport system regulatory protein